MVTHIIAISDIHVRNLKRIEEMKTYFEQFIDLCEDYVKQYTAECIRIVIAGDIFDQKINTSNESKMLTAWFLRQLDKIATTYVICGNHDYLMNNVSRVCSLLPIFTMSQFKQTFYLDRELQYTSDIYEDDNIAWCLYSTFDDFTRPEIELYRTQNPDKTLIGLIHADINGAATDTGRITDKGLDAGYFENLDFVIAGHIHKRQEIKKNGVKIVYCGSFVQQNMGENVSGHGGVIWDVQNKSWQSFDLKNETYGFYKFVIDDVKDIEEDKEKIINL